MKKRVLATLMAVCMVVVGMTGCGNNASGTSTIPQEESIVEVSESYVEGSSTEESIMESESSYEESEVGDGESDRVGTKPMDGSADEAISNPGEQLSNDTGEISGLIMCAQWWFGQHGDYVIFLLNPDTGEYTELQQFSFGWQPDSDYYYESPAIIYHKNQSDRFSNDFSKLAETYVVYGTRESHAGWINADGTFFDVTETLGMGAENEFVEQPNYYSIGFTKEGNYFVFAELTGHEGPVSENILEKDGKFYYVSLDNLSEVYEGNPLKEEATRGYEVFNLTQWINDKEYLSDYYNDNGVICRVTDSSHYTTEEYVPGEARTNLSAIAGPDGSIAFVSKPKNSREDVGVYITQRDGSGLQRVFTCDEIFGYGGRRKENFITMYLLSWE